MQSTKKNINNSSFWQAKKLLDGDFDNVLLKVDLGAVCKNFQIIRSKIKNNVAVAAVLKSDAYGIGILKAAKVLLDAGCNNFFVNSICEAIKIRRICLNSNIYILCPNRSNNDFLEMIRYNLIPITISLEFLHKINDFALAHKKAIKTALHIDTGMNREGLNYDEFTHAIKNNLFSNIKLQMIMTHFASSEKEKDFCKKQKTLFDKMIQMIPLNKRNGCIISAANSGGYFLGKDYQYDMVRVGKFIYGINPKNSNVMPKPVIYLYARVIRVSKVLKGQTIGYEMDYKSSCDQNIATIGIGYANGMPFDIGKAFCDNNGIKIIGKVSMNYCTSIIGGIKIKENQMIEVIGSTMTLNQIAEKLDIVPSEIFLRFNKMNKIVYINSIGEK